MKSILKITFLFFGLLLMSNNTLAQSTAKVDALNQTKALQELTKFEKSKFKAVYAVYLKFDRKLESINRQIDPSTMSYINATDKLNALFAKEMKAVLSEENFKKFLEKEKLTDI